MRHKYFNEEPVEEVSSTIDESVVQEISIEKQTESKQYTAQVITKLLNTRKGPSKTFDTTGKILSLHQIIEIDEIKDGFGKLKGTDAWVDMNYIKPID